MRGFNIYPYSTDIFQTLKNANKTLKSSKTFKMLNMIKYAALMFLFRSHLILCDDGGQLTHQLEPSNDLQKSDEPLQRYATISPIVQRLGGNGNERFRRNSKDPGMNFLRLYLCESGYQNCMADERYFLYYK